MRRQIADSYPGVRAGSRGGASSMRLFRILFRKFIDNRIHIALTAPALMWLWSRLLDHPFRIVDYVILTLVSAFILNSRFIVTRKGE